MSIIIVIRIIGGSLETGYQGDSRVCCTKECYLFLV